MKITKLALENAISVFLGSDVNEAMQASHTSLPSRHNMAIVAAFVDGGHDDDAAVLREAAKRLEEHGHYVWDE